MRILATILVFCALAGCSLTGSYESRTDGVTFEVGQEGYASGDPVTATLVNGSEVDVGYNLCLTDLERRTAEGWSRVAPKMACQAILRMLRPGAEVNSRIEPGSVFDLLAGTYRLVISVEVAGKDRRLRTEAFVVTAAEQ